MESDETHRETRRFRVRGEALGAESVPEFVRALRTLRDEDAYCLKMPLSLHELVFANRGSVSCLLTGEV